MRDLSKIFWALAGLLLLPFLAIRFILGYWWGAPYIFIGLSIPLILCVLAIAVDYKTYLDFLTMKTTKHGLNTGTIILFMLILLVSLNVLSVLNDKSWDLTEEKLYTLSDQSKKVLEELKDDLQLTIFYPGAGAMELARGYKNSLQLYLKASSKVRLRLLDAYVKNVLAQEYFGSLPKNQGRGGDGNQVTIFIDYQNNREKVRLLQSPSQSLEEKMTNAIIKVTRSAQKVVYFLKGHGEHEASEFKKALEDSSFVVKDFKYYGKGSFPTDVDLLVILGMKSPLYEEEFEQLREYAERGGRFFIALDPGEKHEMNRFLNLIGVNYKNNYILNNFIRIIGAGKAWALGFKHHEKSEVTKDFVALNGPSSIFPIVSELGVLANTENIKDFEHKSLIESDYRSYVVKDLSAEKMGKKASKVFRHRTLSMMVQGTLNKEKSSKESSVAEEKKAEDTKKEGDKESKKEEEEDSQYKAIVFGDSDFLASRRMFTALHNKDVALNSVSFLLNEGDLVSIRPKQLEKTKLSLTGIRYSTIILSGVFLPVLLIIFGMGLWLRRRSA